MDTAFLNSKIINFFLIVLCILVFFTILFSGWKKIRPGNLVDHMLTRTYSWWFLVFSCFIFFSINFYFVVFGLIFMSFMSFRELTLNVKNERFKSYTFYVLRFLVLAQMLLAASTNIFLAIIFFPVLVFFVLFLLNIFSFNRNSFLMDMGTLIMFIFVSTYGPMHLLMLYNVSYNVVLPAGVSGLVLYFMFLVQFNDVLQFIFGKLFGKRKIFADISSKTLEGFIGGVVSTSLLSMAFSFLTPFSHIQSIILGFVISTLGFFGDLQISSIKRSMDVKDLGNLIPGHGGLLDRIDSIIFSAIAYFYILKLMNIFSIQL